MRVLKEAEKKISQIWKAEIDREKSYRVCRYVLKEKYNDTLLLYSTVSGELVELDEEEEHLMSSQPIPYSGQIDSLIRKHFLVPLDYDEEKAVIQLRKILSAFSKKTKFSNYVILPTTFCNARCFYCYESNMRHVHMTDETADKVIQFMLSQYSKDKVHVTWFGGEPLIGEKQIDRICSALTEHEIPFTSRMISNGYLFTEANIRKAKTLWNLKKIQITLDGTEKIYNDTKAYISTNGSPYKRVLNNIELLLQNDIRVAVRLNVGMHNIDDLETLVRELLLKFSENKNFNIYLHRLFDDQGFQPVHHTEEDVQTLYSRIFELEKIIEEGENFRGRYTLPKLSTTMCMGDNDTSAVIDPEGKLFKCEHIKEDLCIGNVEEGIQNREIVSQWKECETYSFCHECPIFPECKRLTHCPSIEECSDIILNHKLAVYRKLMIDYARKKGISNS